MKKLIFLAVVVVVSGIYYWEWSNTSGETEHPQPMPVSGKITIDNVAPLFKHGIPDGYVVVDVRTDKEYKAKHTDGMLHFPVALFDDEGACEKVVPNLPKDKKIIFTCPAGPRAEEMFYDLTDPVKDGGCGINPKGMYFLYAKVKYNRKGLVIK